MKKIILMLCLVSILLIGSVGYSFANLSDDNMVPMYIVHCDGDSQDGRHLIDMAISHLMPYTYDVLDDNDDVLYSIPMAQYECLNQGCNIIILVNKGYEHYNARYVNSSEVKEFPGWFSRGQIYDSDLKYFDEDVFQILNPAI